MLRRPLLLLVVLPLAGAAAWWVGFLLWPDPQLDRPYNLLPFLPLAVPPLIALATGLRQVSLPRALLRTTYVATVTIAFAVLGTVPALLLASDEGSTCPNHRIYC